MCVIRYPITKVGNVSDYPNWMFLKHISADIAEYSP